MTIPSPHTGGGVGVGGSGVVVLGFGVVVLGFGVVVLGFGVVVLGNVGVGHSLVEPVQLPGFTRSLSVPSSRVSQKLLSAPSNWPVQFSSAQPKYEPPGSGLIDLNPAHGKLTH